MQVKEIMTPDPRCCVPESNLGEVAQMMLDCDCGEIPIVDSLDSGKPIGVITDRDIVCRTVALGKNPLELRARDCMTSPVITVRPDTDVEDCCKQMEHYQVRRIPVVDANGRCCGLVAQADVANRVPARRTAEVVRQVSQQTYYAHEGL